EAEEKERRRSEREDAHDLDATSPLEEEVLAKGDEEISQAPSANPAPSAPAGSGMSAVAPANTRRPASRTKPRSQSARPRSRRCVAPPAGRFLEADQATVWRRFDTLSGNCSVGSAVSACLAGTCQGYRRLFCFPGSSFRSR